MKNALLSAALILLGGAAACDTVKSTFHPVKDSADVSLQDATLGEVHCTAMPSSNKDCIDGVRHMRNEDWALAAKSFDKATQADPNDDLAFYDRGLVYEKTGDYANALECYKKANFLQGKKYPEYDAARLRVAAKLPKK